MHPFTRQIHQIMTFLWTFQFKDSNHSESGTINSLRGFIKHYFWKSISNFGNDDSFLINLEFSMHSDCIPIAFRMNQESQFECVQFSLEYLTSSIDVCRWNRIMCECIISADSIKSQVNLINIRYQKCD